MSVTLFIPTPLRKLTGGQGKIELPAATLQEVIAGADSEYPGFRDRVLDSNGEIKRFINVFVNGVDVRTLQGLTTPVQDGAEVAVIPAMAGGSGNGHDSEPVLVGVDWLRAHLEDPNLRILDARVSDPRLPVGYRMGHIPHSVPFDMGADVYEIVSGMHRIKPPEAIARILGSRGVGNGNTIVIYDEATGPVAGSIYWVLKYLGHNAHVLDGGWAAWRLAGGPVTREVPQVQPVEFTPEVDPGQRCDADWIQTCGGRQDVVLLDTRSDAEYEMGHIPGAVNLSFDEALDISTQKLKTDEALRQQFESVGATPDKEIVTYCATGARSSHTYLVLKTLGYPRVRNYDGSMMDWAQFHRLPIE